MHNTHLVLCVCDGILGALGPNVLRQQRLQLFFRLEPLPLVADLLSLEEVCFFVDGLVPFFGLAPTPFFESGARDSESHSSLAGGRPTDLHRFVRMSGAAESLSRDFTSVQCALGFL